MRFSARSCHCQEEAQNYGSFPGVTQLAIRAASHLKMYTPTFEKNMFFDAFALKNARVLLPCVAAGFAIFFLMNQNVLLAAGALIIMGKKIAKRSEEHTSELQSHLNLVCRLLLEKKK